MVMPEAPASQPPPRRRRGSIWAGLGIAAFVMLGRVGIHLLISQPPDPGSANVDSWNRLFELLHPLAVLPQTLIAGLFVLGLGMVVIPRTRRTGAGVLIGVAVSAVVLAILFAILLEGLSHASIEP